MASRFLIGLIVFQILILTKGARACQEPPKSSHFVRENLEDDIVMTIVSDEPDVGSHWSVKGIMDDNSDSHLAKSFIWIQKGPIWNLVVTRGIVLPVQDSKRKNVLEINLKIECVDKIKKHSTYPILINVLREDLLEKILITVPENTPTQQFIYYDKEKHSDSPPTYKHHLLPDLDDASGFLELNSVTGSVTLVNTLDYERDPKVMWFLVIKMFKSGKNKLRLFRIEIGNVNDNAPEFYKSDKCLEGRQCKVVSYSFTMDKGGVLKAENGNRIHAVDHDGDVIAYSIVQAMPQQNFLTINKRTGELSAKRPRSDVATRYVLTVKASDGFHWTEAAVIVHIEGDEPADSILELLDIGHSDRKNTGKEQTTKTSLITSLIGPSVADHGRDGSEVTTHKTVMESPTETAKPFSDSPNSDTRHPGDIWRQIMNIEGTRSDWMKLLSNVSKAAGTSRFGANSTGGLNITVDDKKEDEEEQIYLLELCRNLTLILDQDTSNDAALHVGVWNSSAVNATMKDRFNNGTMNATMKDSFNNGTTKGNVSGGGVMVEGMEISDIVGVALLSRNGSVIGIDEANRTCNSRDFAVEKVLGQDDDTPKSAASPSVMGNMLTFVTCFLVSLLCGGL